ncbi:heterokaryon incompatibility protein-domain-containing protein [Rhexocercosporidium sp. MPI-PUGE-AT-0058]|nr:heterokaryon incompatibility protein-domain-containing protein [Rhexocercosporidium sp. MPI-PUGE-AT-0058]
MTILRQNAEVTSQDEREERNLRLWANERNTRCVVCEKIEEAVNSGPQRSLRNVNFELGPVSALLDSKCLVHVQLLSRYLDEVSKQTGKAVHPESKVTVKSPEEYKIMLSCEDSVTWRDPYFQKLQSTSRNSHEHQSVSVSGHAKLIDEDWQDTRLFKSWKDRCIQEHGRDCSPHHNSPSFSARPRLLIDVENLCLVRSTLTMNYIALSYVWGHIESFRTMKANVRDLQVKGALLTAIESKKIPRTIIHALHVTKLAHEKYLWVDALCIVQDDWATKDGELNDMSAIYANAMITIIAAGGSNAGYGIRGLKGISEPRSVEQPVYQLSNRTSMVPAGRTTMKETRWLTRAWTYQEHLFSSRRLVFGCDRTLWICKQAIWSEDIDHINGPMRACYPLKSRVEELLLHSKPWPSLSNYLCIVNNYNKRKLTFPEDVAAAFSGIMASLRPQFPAGFMFGLPETFFDAALLWTPESKVKRRVSTKAAEIAPERSGLPSWSWMGWHGEINPRCWESGTDFIAPTDPKHQLDKPPHKVISYIEWTLHTSMNPQDKGRTIDCNWQRFASLSNTNLDLPLGWVRHEVELSDDKEAASKTTRKGAKTSTGRFFFTHSNFPSQKFRYPIPATPQEPLEPPTHGSAQLLHGRTARATFYAGGLMKNFPGRSTGALRATTSLRDATGAWAGFILIHDRDFLALPETPKGKALELVAISRGYARNADSPAAIEEWELPERPKHGELYEFYNVLWVKWEGSIAYRRGIGRVLKDVWETEKEDIDLWLG